MVVLDAFLIPSQRVFLRLVIPFSSISGFCPAYYFEAVYDRNGHYTEEHKRVVNLVEQDDS